LDRLYVSFPESGFHDSRLVLTDRDRFVAAKFQYAAFLAEGGADTSRELREVVGLLQYVICLFVTAFV
jgi:hypothetical protein